jgi:PD-(D/E)XK nuclease superfamily
VTENEVSGQIVDAAIKVHTALGPGLFESVYESALALVEDLVLVELKAIERVAPVHKKQLLTYLRLSKKRVGLLINFNVELVKDGITRIVNGF